MENDGSTKQNFRTTRAGSTLCGSRGRESPCSLSWQTQAQVDDPLRKEEAAPGFGKAPLERLDLKVVAICLLLSGRMVLFSRDDTMVCPSVLSFSAPSRGMCKGEGQHFAPFPGTIPRPVPGHPDTGALTFTGTLHDAGGHSRPHACRVRLGHAGRPSRYPIWHPGSRKTRIRHQSACSPIRLCGRARISSRHASEVPIYRENIPGSLSWSASHLSGWF